MAATALSDINSDRAVAQGNQRAPPAAGPVTAESLKRAGRPSHGPRKFLPLHQLRQERRAGRPQKRPRHASDRGARRKSTAPASVCHETKARPSDVIASAPCMAMMTFLRSRVSATCPAGSVISHLRQKRGQSDQAQERGRAGPLVNLPADRHRQHLLAEGGDEPASQVKYRNPGCAGWRTGFPLGRGRRCHASLTRIGQFIPLKHKIRRAGQADVGELAAAPLKTHLQFVPALHLHLNGRLKSMQFRRDQGRGRHAGAAGQRFAFHAAFVSAHADRLPARAPGQNSHWCRAAQNADDGGFPRPASAPSPCRRPARRAPRAARPCSANEFPSGRRSRRMFRCRRKSVAAGSGDRHVSPFETGGDDAGARFKGEAHL